MESTDDVIIYGGLVSTAGTVDTEARAVDAEPDDGKGVWKSDNSSSSSSSTE